jgi:hypothetical protein
MAPSPCYDPASIAAIPGLRTAAESVRLLLNEGESITGGLEQAVIEIIRGDMIVGYFEIQRRDELEGPSPAPGQYAKVSIEELESLLREACINLDVLNNLQSFQATTDAGQRILGLNDEARAHLRLQAMRVVVAVHDELLGRILRNASG